MRSRALLTSSLLIVSVLAGVALAAAAPATSTSRSRLVSLRVPSSCVDPLKVVMGDPPSGQPPRAAALRVNVLLPAGYDGKRRFPVLYLLHGFNGAYDSWLAGSQGGLLAAVKNLSAIVVMPDAGAVASYANSWHGGARNPCWQHYYLDELIPSIEHHFRIRPGRRWHAIGGFSSGGLGAMLYGATDPQYFGQLLSFSGVLSIQRPELESGVASLVVIGLFGPTKIAALGPMPWRDAFGDPRAQSFYWAGNNPTVLADTLSHSRIYVSHGAPTAPTCIDPIHPSEHCAAQEVGGGASEATQNRTWAQDFMTAARAAGANVTYRPQTGGHWYGYAAQMLADAITHWGLFAPLPANPTSWTYKTVAATGQMWDLRFAFDRAPETLEVFTRTGHHISGKGTGTVHLHTAAGCTITRVLPFQLDLVTACSSSRSHASGSTSP